tara:strand:- start:2921 stop:3640 length:720 start_codon:yes stop_codon:yes gene_type:complete
MSERKAFASCSNKGFQLTFAGGLVASVQWGPGNYTEKYGNGTPIGKPDEQAIWDMNLAEIACFDSNEPGRWVPVYGFTSDLEDVRGYCDVMTVIGFLNAVQALDRHRNPEAYENYPFGECENLTPAEQAFNSWMGSQKATQADGKPKVDESYLLDEKLGYLPIPCDDDDDDNYAENEDGTLRIAPSDEWRKHEDDSENREALSNDWKEMFGDSADEFRKFMSNPFGMEGESKHGDENAS